jgi:hypothetical protein
MDDGRWTKRGQTRIEEQKIGRSEKQEVKERGKKREERRMREDNS